MIKSINRGSRAINPHTVPNPGEELQAIIKTQRTWQGNIDKLEEDIRKLSATISKTEKSYLAATSATQKKTHKEMMNVQKRQARAITKTREMIDTIKAELLILDSVKHILEARLERGEA